MSVENVRPEGPRWELVLDLLDAANHARWVLDEERRLLPDHHVLAVFEEGEAAGVLVLHLRELVVPPTDWTGGVATTLRDPDGRPLYETFVQSFHVREARRRRGIGRALQEAALALTGALGALQMRSWSSVDRPANYALKLGLGFACHPATQVTPSGQEVSGVYFVARAPSAAPR